LAIGLLVLERYYRELLGFLSRKVSDRATASDLAQESYVRVYSAQQAGAVVRDPRALLYKTARNLVVDQARRSDVRTRFAEPQDDVASNEPDNTLGPTAFEPDAVLGSQQMVNAILRTIDSLPPRCRQAFMLHKFDGLTHAEVAARMGISIKMVEQHVRNAVEACRRCREETNGDRPPVPPLQRRKRSHE
jgi:RNA polymerase sigma factor (sigma-70 family)